MSEQPGGRDLVAEFEAAYETTPPWDIGAPQPAFAVLAAEAGCEGECSMLDAARASMR